MKTMLLLIATMMVMVSCKKYDSADVDANEIRQNYTVKYYSNINVTEVEGSFRYKNWLGRRVVLTGSAGLSYAGQAMQYDNGPDVYRTTFNGNLLGSNFQFTYNSGNVYTNTVPVLAPVNVNFGGTVYMDRTRPFSLTIGNVINSGSNSSYRLYLGNNIYTGYRTYNNRVEFYLTESQMQNILTGYHLANISHLRITSLQQKTNAGGELAVEYISKDFAIYVY